MEQKYNSKETKYDILACEARQERKIATMADRIKSEKKKVVLIAGPSSSGKTTFSRRLTIQLLAIGMKPHPVSLDDYYVDRIKTPLDEKGEYDYESLYALNLPLLSTQLDALRKGQEVELPRYDFHTGESIINTGNKLRLDEDDVLILEGIHALNPELTATVPRYEKMMVYVSPHSATLRKELGMDSEWRGTDNRLLRRIIRDAKYRNAKAEDTLKRWQSVRDGERKWIDPYTKEADELFDTALHYELRVIKPQAVEALRAVTMEREEYGEAQRLLHLLADIDPMPDDSIPPTSLLREFLGGSMLADD